MLRGTKQAANDEPRPPTSIRQPPPQPKPPLKPGPEVEARRTVAGASAWVPGSTARHTIVRPAVAGLIGFAEACSVRTALNRWPA
jgi:hypothetical protein